MDFFKTMWRTIQWHTTKSDYPVKLVVLKRRGNSQIRIDDKAKRKYDKKLNLEYWDTVNSGKIPKLNVDSITSDNTAVIYEYSPNNFAQVDPTKLVNEGDELEIKPLDESGKSWYSMSIKKREVYLTKDIFSTILPYIGLFVFAISIVIVAQFTFAPAVGTYEKVAQAQAQTAQMNYRMFVAINYTLSRMYGVDWETATGGGPIAPINRTIIDYLPGVPF